MKGQTGEREISGGDKHGGAVLPLCVISIGNAILTHYPPTPGSLHRTPQPHPPPPAPHHGGRDMYNNKMETRPEKVLTLRLGLLRSRRLPVWVCGSSWSGCGPVHLSPADGSDQDEETSGMILATTQMFVSRITNS